MRGNKRKNPTRSSLFFVSDPDHVPLSYVLIGVYSSKEFSVLFGCCFSILQRTSAPMHVLWKNKLVLNPGELVRTKFDLITFGQHRTSHPVLGGNGTVRDVGQIERSRKCRWTVLQLHVDSRGYRWGSENKGRKDTKIRSVREPCFSKPKDKIREFWYERRKDRGRTPNHN